ncbi:MAG: alpha/beta hydrolase [Mucilaginibacter sp.]|uniref:alpha/beta hydrolase n=1 Tax=Mucilaginibacter sp. TaxID=1882438 RepID=UPI0031AEB1F9
MIRFIISIALLLVSLLAIFKAPEYYLWMLAILVTEFPWIFMLLSLASLLSGFYVDKYQLAGSIAGLVALILFTTPIVRAYSVASNLKQELSHAFSPDSENSQTPFSFWKQFSPTKKVAFQTLPYNNNLMLDYYPSSISGNRPCVVVVHGGSWSSGDSKQLPELNSYLATIGYHVASINYRLAPGYKNPAPVEDLLEAISYLKKHSAALHIDTGNFVLLGRSAGAQIALLTAYAHKQPGLKAVIDFYGPADMVWGYSAPASPLVMDSRKVMENYLGGTYRQVPQQYADSSPIEFVNSHSLPTLILHGDNDVLVSPEHSTRLNLKLQQSGIKHFLLKLPWATHGFDYNLHGPGGQLSTYAVERFLKVVTQ